MNMNVLRGLAVAMLVLAVAAMPTACAAEASRDAPAGAVKPAAKPQVGAVAVHMKIEGPPPKPIILRFRNIPAESFMRTLKQLEQNPRVGEALRQVPIALNPEANCVVVIGPPELADFLGVIAKGLDQPNEFRAATEQMERQNMEFRLKIAAEKHKLGLPPGPPPGVQPGPGPRPPTPGQMGPPPGQPQGPGPRPPMPGQMGPPPGAQPGGMGRGMMRGPGMGGPPEGTMPGRGMGGMMGRGMMGRGMGGPGMGGPPEGTMPGRGMGGMMGRGMMGRGMGGPGMGGPPEGTMPGPGMGGPPQGPGPMMQPGQPERPMAEGEAVELRSHLSVLALPEAKERLGLSNEQVEKIRNILAGVRGGPMRERMQEALKNLPPEQRVERTRELMQRGTAEYTKRLDEAHAAAMGVLTPAQREKFEQWLKERGRRAMPESRETPQPGRREGGPPASPAPLRRPEGAPVNRPEGAPSAPSRGARPGAGATSPAPASPAVWESSAPFILIAAEEGGAPPAAAPAPTWAPKTGGGGFQSTPPRSGVDVEAAPGAQPARAHIGAMLIYSADPELRAAAGLSAEQDSKISALQEKTRKMIASAQEEAKQKFEQGHPETPTTDEQRAERQLLMREALGQAMAALQPQFQAMVKEATDILSEDQQTKLAAAILERSRMMAYSGGLWVLTTARAQQELGLSDEVAAQIKKVIADMASQMSARGTATIGNLKDLSAEERASQIQAKAKEHMQQAQEVQAKAREQIFSLLTPDQKAKAEKLVAGAGSSMRPAQPRMPRSTMPSGHPPVPGGASAPGASAPAPSPFALVADGATARFYLVEDAPPPMGPPSLPPGATEAIQRIQQIGQQYQWLQGLEDAETRAQVGLTPEQDAKIRAMRQKATAIFEDMQKQVQDRFQQMRRPDITEEERQALQQDLGKAIADAVQTVEAEIVPIAKEASALLTDEQRVKLKDMSRERNDMDQLTGGLSALLTPQAKEQLDLTSDHLEKIRMMLRELVAEAKKVRDRMFGAGKDLTPEDMKSDKYQEFRKENQEMVKETRERVLTLFGLEQREKVDKFLQQRRGSGGRTGRRGGGPAGGPPPGTPAPGAPAPGASAPARSPFAMAADEAPARFYLVQDGGDAPPNKPARAQEGGGPKPGEGTKAARQIFQLLDDPAAREKLGLTADQASRIKVLRDEAQSLNERIRVDVRSKTGPPPGPDATAEDRDAYQRQMKTALGEAMVSVQPQIDDVMRDIAETLTPEQRVTIRQVGQEQNRQALYSGGLGILTNPKVRDQLGLSSEVAAKIRAIVAELEADSKRLYEEAFGPGGEPKPGQVKGEKAQELRRRHQAMVKEARDRILTLLTTEQREKVEKMTAESPAGGPKPFKKPGPPASEPATKGYGETG